jgi:hypothetical protein
MLRLLLTVEANANTPGTNELVLNKPFGDLGAQLCTHIIHFPSHSSIKYS